MAASHLRAADLPSFPARSAADTAAERGVAFLVSRLTAEGSIQDGKGNETAQTSLAIMAMLACGHLPGDPSPEGAVLRRAVAFVLRDDRQMADGYFGKADGSRMYGHGITTLMLTELLGMCETPEQDEAVRRKGQRALDLILASQRARKSDPVFVGGWRYQPTNNDADLSVTVWQLLALRSARNTGFDVPAAAIDDAVAYMTRSFQRRGNSRAGGPAHGGFRYYPHTGRSSWSMTAAGALAMQICGRDDAPETAMALETLRNPPGESTNRWFYYGNYYYAQAAQRAGGAMAEQGRLRIEAEMPARQQLDGSFAPAGEGEEKRAGRVYTTSLAVMSLAVKHRYLPVYQE